MGIDEIQYGKGSYALALTIHGSLGQSATQFYAIVEDKMLFFRHNKSIRITQNPTKEKFTEFIDSLRDITSTEGINTELLIEEIEDGREIVRKLKKLTRVLTLDLVNHGS